LNPSVAFWLAGGNTVPRPRYPSYGGENTRSMSKVLEKFPRHLTLKGKEYPMVVGSGVTPAGYFLVSLPEELADESDRDHTRELEETPETGMEVHIPAKRPEGQLVHDCSSAQLAVQFSPGRLWQPEG